MQRRLLPNRKLIKPYRICNPLAKVAEDGNALEHASDKWRNNTKVVLAVAAKRGCVADDFDGYECPLKTQWGLRPPQCF